MKSKLQIIMGDPRKKFTLFLLIYISRRLPISNPSRKIALNHARDKKDSPPPGGNILTAATTTRLDNITPDYNDGMSEMATAQALLSTNTPLKDAGKDKARMFASHFIQVFDLGVKRGKYVKAHRAFYQLPIDSEALPEMGTEEEILNVCKNLVDGDADRIAAGGAAMANPAIAEVNTEYLAFKTLFETQSNLSETLDNKQEAVETLNEEADKVIKKVWDEVETFYNEESDESKRANAREWGVVYVTVGGPTIIKGTVKDEASTLLEGATVLLVEADHEVLTEADGEYEMQTTIVGDAALRVSLTGFITQDISITIEEGIPLVVNVVLVKEV